VYRALRDADWGYNERSTQIAPGRVRVQLVGGGSNYYSDEEERGEDKCEGNHRVKENNTNINIWLSYSLRKKQSALRRSVDKWASKERISC
jgi:hypothetical protein